MEFIYPKCTIMTNLNDDILKKIESAGRTCYKSEEKITKESYTKFVNGLIKSGHESVIEHSSITVRFIIDRAIAMELIRHRLCSFCLSGDTVLRAYSNTSGNAGKSWTIQQLYDWSTDQKRKGRLKLIQLRSVDENKVIVPGKIKSILYNGEQFTYNITTKSGRNIRATKQHKFLTPTGWKILADISIGDRIIANGLAPVDNKEWLIEQYITLNKTRKEVAQLAGCCESYIYKAFKKFNIFKPLSDRPNRKPGHGKKGMFTDEQKKEISERMKGDKSPHWKGNNIGSSGGRIRANKIYTPDICWGCNTTTLLERHHIDKNPINNSIENILFLCQSCHSSFHIGQGVRTVFSDEIINIEEFGIEPTYDIEMLNEPHNFVANGLVVHNSQESTRYCTYDKHVKFIIPLWCENIKEGIYDTAFEMNNKLNLQECEYEFVWHLEDTEESYQRLLKYDWLAEEARSVLPNCLKTEIVTTTNIREWRHILSLRTSKGAHPQIKEVMFPLLEEFAKVLPIAFDDIYQIRKEEKFFKNKKFNTIIEYDKTI